LLNECLMRLGKKIDQFENVKILRGARTPPPTHTHTYTLTITTEK